MRMDIGKQLAERRRRLHECNLKQQELEKRAAENRAAHFLLMQDFQKEKESMLAAKAKVEASIASMCAILHCTR